jgi:hypothetical protein
MVAEDTPRRAASAEDGRALCRWERTADGGLIAKWRRGCRVSPDATLYGYGSGVHRHYTGTDRQRPSASRLRASERLTAAAVIASMYVITGFGLFSAFVTR